MSDSFLSIDQISLSSDGNQLMLKISPVAVEIDVDDIKSFLQTPSIPQFKFNLNGIEQAVNAFNVLYEADDPNAHSFKPIAVAEKQDALLEILISDDEMSAIAKITTSYGGNPITLSDVKTECDMLNIKFGILTKNILGLINISKKADAGRTFKIKIAQGIQAIDGEDASFSIKVNTENHRKPTPKLLDNGKVDMRDLGQSITVKAGTLLMVKTPLNLGKPGKKITGEVIVQKSGIDKAFVEQKNVQIDPNNPLHLIASINGIPIEFKGFIRIDDVMLLESVNHKTGHVVYDGTVVITGDVCESMRVNASGDITVMGVIESADVRCGGDLTVNLPIIGHHQKSDNEYSCTIKCGGNLRGSIAQYAKLRVAKNITLSNQLMQCDTICKGTINIQDGSQRLGSIIGGVTAAYNTITTTTTGTKAGTKTTIKLLTNIKQLQESKTKYIHDIQATDEMLTKLKYHEQTLTKSSFKSTNKNVLKLINFEKQQYRDESDRLQQLLLVTKNKIKLSYDNAILTVTNALHSDTIVEFDSQIWHSDKEYGPSSVLLLKKTLQLIPYQKQQSPA
jgi:uncharacterized protein (DUF342 family)